MSRRALSSRRRSLAVAALCLALLATLFADEPAPVPKDLGGGDRLAAHLATDKPMYRAGETLYARAVLVTPQDGRLFEEAVDVFYEVKGPKGDVVANAAGLSEKGIAAFNWTVPEGTPGGEYTLVARFPRKGYAPAETKFDVRAYRVPRLRTDLQFVRKGYGPGEEVAATLSATRAEGGVPAGARVTAIARVDGVEVSREDLALDEKGRCAVSFRLPEAIETGDGSLALVIQDGGIVETAAKTIPILLDKVSLAFYPEGGDLVAGLESRVYFEARDVREKPADVAGRIMDRAGNEVARFETAHEGRGVLSFVPRAREAYHARLDRPAGSTRAYELPAVAEDGCSLAAGDEVVEAGAPARFRVASTSERAVKLVLSRLERELAATEVRLAAAMATEVALALPASAEGVLRATLVDGTGRPLGERLIFRRPARSVRVELVATPERGTPGARVTLEVRTTDESGRPVASTVCLAATDDAVLEKIEPRERAPRLPVQVLLANEVRELADAHVYLSDSPEAPRALDLLLATQGWRRFAFFEPEAFVKNQGDPARRVLALRQEPPLGRVFDEADGIPDAGGAVRPAEALEAAPGVAPGAAGEGEGAEEAQAVEKLVEKEEAAEGKKDIEAGRLRRAIRERVAFVREYAHQAPQGRRPEERTDFAETVYWNAGLATGAEGKRTVSFDLSDSVTSFRVRADAITSEGALGEADLVVESFKPFYLEPKLPLEVTAGDLIEIPVALRNGTATPTEAALVAEAAKGLTVEGHEPELALAAGGSGRVYLTVVADRHQGPVRVRIAGRAGAESDDVTREVRVVPFGFPVEIAHGGRATGTVRHGIEIPAGVERSSIVAAARVYPTPLASMVEALKGLLREPSGCFEQTSACAYPNIMVMNYLASHHVADPELVARANDLLDQGYRRLAGYECREKGYEWFGGDPGHEALTAYGVMEFTDMARVYPVDRGMLERTRSWLLSRRDGKGGFTRNPRALDTFGGAPDDITNAYIVWALLEAGVAGLEKEVASIEARAAGSEDPYFLALAANVLALSEGGRETASALAKRVAERQDTGGAVRGAETSITRSGGESLEIETTSLAILAWLRLEGFAGNVERAAGWLFESAKNGRFGATQSTILALKAVIGYDAAHARPKAPGTLVLSVDGKEVGRVPFTTETAGALELPEFASLLVPGRHEIAIAMEGGSEMPYALDVRYYTSKPASVQDAPVRIATSISAARAVEGETVEVAVRVSNATKEGQPMTVAIVGLPGGVEPRHDQLKELVKSRRIDAYEVMGREVVLYWRSLAPEAVHDVRLSCLAAVPGKYTGPASRAYLYYTDEKKEWVDGLAIVIERRE